MKTLAEKVAYNETQKGGFPRGYCAGVRFYQSYGKKGKPVDKKKHNQFIDDMKEGAKKHSYCKGFMCGIRDAANERKSKVIASALNAAAKPITGKKKR